jgi:endonuclease YncB( thermonuclease family)
MIAPVVVFLVDFRAGFAGEAAGAEAAASPTPGSAQPATPSVPGTHAPGSAAVATGSSPSSPTENPTAITEWLNQTVRLSDTTEAFDKPSSDGKSSGRIRAGAEVKAIGVVVDKHWVQVELPDHSLAYVPRAVIEFENGPVAPSALVGDQRLRLSGIDPGPQEALPPFENWVRTQGALQCERDAQTGRYRCFTASGVDVAEAAILNGAGRVGDGATPEYRNSETQARQSHRGLWQGA